MSFKAREAALLDIARAEQALAEARARLAEAISESASARNVLNDLNFAEQLARRN